jgi:hypothetical protein
MNVWALTELSTDVPYWVAREVFLSRFDQIDFRCRDVEEIAPAYRRDWFHNLANERLGFYVPTVSAIANRTDLINGRHRLAVLLPHLHELPIAFAMQDIEPQSQECRFLQSIPKKPLAVSISFWLPDFPFL